MTVEPDFPADLKQVNAPPSTPRRNGGTPRHALGAAECWVLEILRHMFTGAGGWAVAQQQIALGCRLTEIEGTVLCFERLAEVLASGARRKIAVGPTGLDRVRADEVSLLNLIGAAQEGDFVHVDALARWLVVPVWQGRLLSIAAALGAGLAASDIRLPRRRAAVAADLRMVRSSR
jgi:hypothetical protein